MPLFLANENVPREAVLAARNARIEIDSIREIAPGADDAKVLERARDKKQVLVTFDKDFGELAFRYGLDAVYGVILLRPRLRSPDYLARFPVQVLQQPIDWQGRFAVAEEGRVRLVPLPK